MDLDEALSIQVLSEEVADSRRHSEDSLVRNGLQQNGQRRCEYAEGCTDSEIEYSVVESSVECDGGSLLQREISAWIEKAK